MLFLGDVKTETSSVQTHTVASSISRPNSEPRNFYPLLFLLEFSFLEAFSLASYRVIITIYITSLLAENEYI